ERNFVYLYVILILPEVVVVTGIRFCVLPGQPGSPLAQKSAPSRIVWSPWLPAARAERRTREWVQRARRHEIEVRRARHGDGKGAELVPTRGIVRELVLADPDVAGTLARDCVATEHAPVGIAHVVGPGAVLNRPGFGISKDKFVRVDLERLTRLAG